MAAILQDNPQPQVNLFDQQAAINRSKRIAQLLSQQKAPDPNAMVSGRVVPISPASAILSALSGGIGSYYDQKANRDEEALNKNKASILAGALRGETPDYATMVQNGAIEPTKSTGS